ncbi:MULTISPECIES: hypothetical protein [Ruminococcus]|uniref:Lasso peptide n=1 Tax=Ruminococcus flavefaciens TaxID=1265 RepID=A0A1M7M990_RUMFL|nr:MULTISPECIES: hypothetical protein [Ruminococcus]SHM87343.1 hypothetical protein SAMN04487860_12010 [Ruminococcus flavefaciens]
MEKYTTPELEIIKFDAEDVITTSFGNGGESGDMGGSSDITF